jgi:hypothetical protein
MPALSGANRVLQKSSQTGPGDERKSIRPMLDLVFLLAVLAIVVSVYQFCPGQHMF